MGGRTGGRRLVSKGKVILHSVVEVNAHAKKGRNPRQKVYTIPQSYEQATRISFALVCDPRYYDATINGEADGPSESLPRLQINKKKDVITGASWTGRTILAGQSMHANSLKARCAFVLMVETSGI